MNESDMQHLKYVRMDNALCEQTFMACFLQGLYYEKAIENPLTDDSTRERYRIDMEVLRGKSFFWGKVAEAQRSPDDWEKRLELELLLNHESLHDGIKARFASALQGEAV